MQMFDTDRSGLKPSLLGDVFFSHIGDECQMIWGQREVIKAAGIRPCVLW